MEPASYVSTPVQRLFDSRRRLDELISDSAKTAQEISREIRNFLVEYAPTFTAQQAPALILLQKKVSRMPSEQMLEEELKTLIGFLPVSSDPDDAFLNIIAKKIGDPQQFDNAIRVLPANTPFQEDIKKGWRNEAQRIPEEFVRALVCERTAQSVAEASSPFFQACANHDVNPFSLMCTKREVVLTPVTGYSPVHVAALEPDLSTLKTLFGQDPSLFEEKMPLGGTAWDLLRARGHGLDFGPLPAYPAGVNRQYVTRNVLQSESCQDFMKLLPNALHPHEELAFQQCVEREQQGEPDPIEIFEIVQGPLKGQWGARASSDLKAGAFVVEYRGVVPHKKSFALVELQKGEMIKEGYAKLKANGEIEKLLDQNALKNELEKESYNLNFLHSEPLCVKALTKGSWAEMINHGAPNCAMFEYVHEGMIHIGILTLRDIPAGEELHIDYGRGYFFGRIEPIELTPERIDAYLEETHNLSFISHFMTGKRDDGKEGWLQLQITRTKKGEPQSRASSFPIENSAELPEIYTRAFYHRAMIDYICHYTKRIFEHLKGPKGHEIVDNLIGILEYAKSKNQLDSLGMTPDDVEMLIAQIQQVYRD